MIFLGVAAFLLSIVIGRLVKTQQGQIAILKAFGYTNLEIGLHYVLMVSVIVFLGLVAGVAFGVYLGGLMSDLYAQYYKFPFLRYELNAPVLLAATGISFGSALAGVFVSVRKAVRLSPAEGMRPEPPQIFQRNLLERFSLIRRLDMPSKMILRQLSRHRLKALFSVIGIAFALALVMIGRMSNDSVNLAVEQEFRRAQPNDLTVMLDQPVAARMIHELESIPGVYAGEAYRTLPVRMRHEHRSYLTSIQAFPQEGRLRRLLDSDGNRVAIPPSGILLTEKLGEILRLVPGDTVRVELLENSRRTLEIPVAGFMNQFFGLGSYMSMEALDRIVPERGLVSGAYLLADREREPEIMRELADRPLVADILSSQTLIELFNESTALTWLIMAFIVSLFAGATAFSVVYNNARISLSERSRDLASLRVLGFTRAEIAFILLGELWILVLIAIPVGMVLGSGLTAFIIWSLQTEMYRIPLNITSTTYALGALTVLLSTVLSAWVIRRKLNRLDLIGVLKTIARVIAVCYLASFSKISRKTAYPPKSRNRPPLNSQVLNNSVKYPAE
ncbi:MAG: ABC transporter permease [Bacteroidota bacterium]